MTAARWWAFTIAVWAVLVAVIAYGMVDVIESNGVHVFPDGIRGPTSGVVEVGVKQFGAKGDGVTDDTNALKKAFQKCPATGCRLVVPPGTYIVTPGFAAGCAAPMQLRSNMTVECEAGATFKFRDSTKQFGSTLNCNRFMSNIDGNNDVQPANNVVIRGCTFDGNQRGNAINVINIEMVACSRCTGFTVEHSTFLDNNMGLSSYTGNDIRFVHNRFFSIGQDPEGGCVPGQICNGDPIQVNGGRDFQVNGNKVENTGEGIFAQHGTASSNKYGNGVVAEAAVYGTINDNVIVKYAANEMCEGSGNPFSCCTGIGTGDSTGFCRVGQARGGALGVLGSHVTVSGNTLKGVSQIEVEGGRGFESANVDVVGNTSTGGVANCIAVIAISGAQPNADQPVHDVTIASNYCSDATNGIGVYGANLNAPYNVDIVGNTVQGTQTSAVFLTYQVAGGATAAIRDVTIRGNHFRNTAGTNPASCPLGGSTCGGLFFDDNGGSPAFTRIKVYENTFEKTQRYAFWIEGTETNVDVERNVFDVTGSAGVFNFVAGASLTRLIRNTIFSNNVYVGTPVVGTVVDDNGVGFATLGGGAVFGAATNGSHVYCTDCALTTNMGACAGAGNGTEAWRLNGAWKCQ